MRREDLVKEIDPEKLKVSITMIIINVSYYNILFIKVMEWVEGKKGNIRALLGTLHTVLWEGSGWNCNLSNLVTYADVKKAYRKACLAVHPDKVKHLNQQNITVSTKKICI